MSENYDPWQNIKTKNGYNADELISALQKEIRRGHEENAAAIAHEMATTGTELENYLWARLRTISVEDIGMADRYAVLTVHSLDMMRREATFAHDREMFAIHAVRYLSSSLKDRSTDELLCWIKKGGILPEIPDYAFDKHTRRGQEMGRSSEHFMGEASKVAPEWEERNKSYRNKLLDLMGLKKEK